MNNFFRRTLTGAWIVLFVMGGFWLHPITFFLTGLVMLIGSQYEYYLMIRKTGIRPQLLSGMITGTAVYVISTLIAAGLIPKNYFLFLIPAILIIMVVELYRKQDKPFDSLSHTFFAILYTCLLYTSPSPRD